MTAPTGWLCPSCGKAHGPHVATCDAAERSAAVETFARKVISAQQFDEKRLGRRIEIEVSRALAKGALDPVMNKRYGARPRFVPSPFGM